MMKSFLYILLSFLIVFFTKISFGQNADLIKIRELCANEFLKKHPDEIIKSIDVLQYRTPLMDAYKGIAILLKAKNSFSPFEKVKYFKEGKLLLENSICIDNTCIELRYLRFCVQTNVPFFLNYSQQIEIDKTYIIQNWQKLADTDLKERIRKIMTTSRYCNNVEINYFLNG